MKKYIPVLLLIILITSCDIRVHVDKIVQNDSSYDIRLELKGGKNLVIPKKKQTVVEVDQKFAEEVKEDYSSCHYTSIESVVILSENGALSLDKDILNKFNWRYSKVEKRKGECVFTISDSDISY